MPNNDFFHSVFVTAMEGGINYWCTRQVPLRR